jgi:hypothetical protein
MACWTEHTFGSVTLDVTNTFFMTQRLIWSAAFAAAAAAAVLQTCALEQQCFRRVRWSSSATLLLSGLDLLRPGSPRNERCILRVATNTETLRLATCQ